MLPCGSVQYVRDGAGVMVYFAEDVAEDMCLPLNCWGRRPNGCFLVKTREKLSHVHGHSVAVSVLKQETYNTWGTIWSADGCA